MENKSFWQKNKSYVIFGAIALILGTIYVSMSISYNNHANQLEVQVDKKIKSNKADFDAVWKIISQQAGVVDKYQESFKEIYTGLMDNRYSDGQGQMMSWVQEHSPNFDATMFNNLMNTIEAQRTDFATRQKEMVAVEEEYNKMLVTFPGSFFVGDREPMDNVIVTSTKTEETFKSGKEDDIEIF